MDFKEKPTLVILSKMELGGCGEDSICRQFNNPPWFYSSLPQVIRDNVEVCLCSTQPSSNEVTIVYLMELYVGQGKEIAM